MTKCALVRLRDCKCNDTMLSRTRGCNAGGWRHHTAGAIGGCTQWFSALLIFRRDPPSARVDLCESQRRTTQHYTCFNRVNTRRYASAALFTSLVQFAAVNWTYTFYFLLYILGARYSKISSRENAERNDCLSRFFAKCNFYTSSCKYFDKLFY